jgi:hypothetical protein
MKPIQTESTNGTLAAAKGTEDYVIPLPITRTEDMVSSCWKMSWRERITALITGRVWCDCLGWTHPPIRLRVFREIEK